MGLDRRGVGEHVEGLRRGAGKTIFQEEGLGRRESQSKEEKEEMEREQKTLRIEF